MKAKLTKKRMTKALAKITDEHPGPLNFTAERLPDGAKVLAASARGYVYVRFHDKGDNLGIHFRMTMAGAGALTILLNEIMCAEILGMQPSHGILRKGKKK